MRHAFSASCFLLSRLGVNQHDGANSGTYPVSCACLTRRSLADVQRTEFGNGRQSALKTQLAGSEDRTAGAIGLCTDMRRQLKGRRGQMSVLGLNNPAIR